MNRRLMTFIGFLGLVGIAAGCGGAGQQVQADKPAAPESKGGEVRKGSEREDLTLRSIEVMKEPEYVEGVDKSAQDAFRKGVIAVSKTPPDYATAKASYEAAVAKDKAFLEAWFNLGMLYERTGKPLDAVSTYKHAMDANPGNLDAQASVGKVYLALAKRARSDGDTAKASEFEGEARKIFDSVIQQNPDNVAANNAMALYWLFKGDRATAEDFVKKVLLVQPRNVVALNTRGLINLQAGKLSIARWVFEEKALGEDANSTEALTNLGLTYFKMGKAPQAVSSFEKAILVDPDNFEARMNVAAIYLEYLHYQAALDQYDAALRLVPNQVEALIGSGSSLLGLHKPQDALDRWQKALKEDPDRAILYARIGKIYESQLNDLGKAIENYDLWVSKGNPPANDPIKAKLPVLKEMKANGGMILMPPEPPVEEKKDPAAPAAVPAAAAPAAAPAVAPAVAPAAAAPAAAPAPAPAAPAPAAAPAVVPADANTGK